MIKYSADHVWIDVDGDRGRIGVTDFAQKELGDVVFIELPEIGAALRQGQSFGTIESAKAIAELYTPVSGEVVEVNDWLKTKPASVNTNPQESWLVAVRLTQPGELDGLLSAEQYAALAT